MERRKIGLALAASALLLAVAIERPHANIQLEMHDVGDPAPHRIQAALDMGVMAISVLVTWTSHQLSH